MSGLGKQLRGNGTKVVILSRGYESHIRFLLKLVRLEQYFDAIYGAEDNFAGWSKDMMIYKMLEAGKSVVYYDDDSQEHNDLITLLHQDNKWQSSQDGNYDKETSGQTTYAYFKGLVKNRKGLTTETIRNIPADVSRLLGTQGGRRRKTCRSKSRRGKSRRGKSRRSKSRRSRR